MHLQRPILFNIQIHATLQSYLGILEKSLLRILFIKYPVNLIHVYLRLMVICINLAAPQPPLNPSDQQTIPKCECRWVPPPVCTAAGGVTRSSVHVSVGPESSAVRELHRSFSQLWPSAQESDPRQLDPPPTHRDWCGSASISLKWYMASQWKEANTHMSSLTCGNFFLWAHLGSSKLGLMLLKNLSTVQIGIVLCAFRC